VTPTSATTDQDRRLATIETITDIAPIPGADTFIPKPTPPGTRPPLVLFTRGLPASGKTTWARGVANSRPAGQVRTVSLDDLRNTIDGGRTHEAGFNRAAEDSIKHVLDLIVTEAVDAGSDVIVHNTHAYPKIPNRIRRLVALDADLAIVDFTDVPKAACIERDAERAESVGPEVIDRIDSDMRRGAGGFKHWRTFTPDHAELAIADSKPAPVQHDQVTGHRGLPYAVMVDLDGTLAIHDGRSPYDAAKCGTDLVNQAVATALQGFASPMHVILCSGREDTHLETTEAWARHHGIRWDRLLMRKAGDHRPDSVVKRELFEFWVRDSYNVIAVLDDRDSVVRMWRRIGLPVWQVAEGRF